MPLCYGGGIKTEKQAKKIISLGVEKIALSSLAVENPIEIRCFSESIGSQSIVIVLDVKKHKWKDSYEVFTHNGKIPTGKIPSEVLSDINEQDFGEVVINSIDNDGLMSGYDAVLIDQMKELINCPLTVLGGAGSLSDFGLLIRKYGTIGAAAGSLFVFKGKYHAVLINYPDDEEKRTLLDNCY